MVSMVATASYSGVESSTRLAPTNPGIGGCLHGHLEDPAIVVGRGRAGPACRPAPCARTPGSRSPTRRTHTSSGHRTRTPRPPRGPTDRTGAATPSPPPRSEVAPTGGPVAANRSANNSSGNNRWHSRCSTDQIESSLHPVRHEARRALHQISLPRRQPHRHDRTVPENHMHVILPNPCPKREHSRPRKTPAT